MPHVAVLCYCLLHLVGHDQSVAALECGSTGWSPLTVRVAQTIREAGVPTDVPQIGNVIAQVLGS